MAIDIVLPSDSFRLWKDDLGKSFDNRLVPMCPTRPNYRVQVPRWIRDRYFPEWWIIYGDLWGYDL